jgi:hypothetical protein
VAVTVVNSAGGNYTTNTGSHSVDWSGFFTPTAGNALLLTLHSGPNADAPVSAPSGWTEVQKGADGAPFGCVVYRKENVSSGDTSATITGWSVGGQNGRWSVVEFGGVPATGAFGPSAKAVEPSGSTTITAGPTASLSQATGLAVGIFVVDNGNYLNGAWSAGTWTTITDQPRSTSGGHTVAYRALDSAAGISATYSGFTFDQSWITVVAVYDMEGGGGGGAVSLVIADCSHDHAAGSLGLSTELALAVADALHSHSAESPAPSTQLGLAIADASHAHSAESLTLGTSGSASLSIGDALHAHTAGAPVLTVLSALTVADALHAHTADNVGLGASGSATLTVASASHAHAADGIDLTSAQALVAANASHAHSADSLDLATNIWLAVNGASHAHAADSITLSLSTPLDVADALHAHAADGLVLSTELLLTAGNALHGHTAGNVDLSGAPYLQVANSLHAHTADGVTMNVYAWLAVASATHGHSAENLNIGGMDPNAVLSGVLYAHPRRLTHSAINPRRTIRAAQP